MHTHRYRHVGEHTHAHGSAEAPSLHSREGPGLSIRLELPVCSHSRNSTEYEGLPGRVLFYSRSLLVGLCLVRM